MARAVIHSLTASPNLQISMNSEMDRKATALECQITADTKPWVVASDNVNANEINDTGTDVYDPHHSRTLFVRFPRGIKDKLEVKRLHPGIEAVRFKPRIKRWCHIRFSSEELAKSALKELNQKEVKGGKLIIKETKKYKLNTCENESKKTPQLYQLYVKNLPENVTESEITSAFPGCMHVHMFTPKKKGSLGAIIGFKTLDKMEAIISSTKVHKVRDKDVSVSYAPAHSQLKQEQQEVNNHTEISKDVSRNCILTTVSSPEIKINSVRKQKTVLTSECPGKMVDTRLPQFKNEGNDRDSDDSGEDGGCNEDTEMDTQDCTGCNGEGTDSAGSDDDSDDLSQYKPIKLEGKDTKNSDDFSEDNINEIKFEVTETSEDDGDDFSQYRAIKLEDKRGKDDDFLQYKAIKLEDEVTDPTDEEDGDLLQYKAIELEDDISKTDDDFSQYKPIELEDEVTE
ncbi:hypothetical protein B7P43_G14802 [Cryptotermes secundus]|uniref:RRM domain-containing protein n=1 Tax=Cryptotermes secundus TaxID=105785 RepID=A0A2J7QAV5_9NEOP|nr:hypothetical protein B7P43_G14802 [Cryptotermes secundus]PNF25723.1 hypothetical protein B7P43_G14802 [Cryptotermes secundus]